MASKKTTPATKKAVAKSATKTITFANTTLKVVEQDGVKYATETTNNMAAFNEDNINYVGAMHLEGKNVIVCNANETIASQGNPINGLTDTYYKINE